jgi:hypothetical protein
MKTIKTYSKQRTDILINKTLTLNILPHLPRLGDKSTDLDLDLDPGGDLDVLCTDDFQPRSASDLYNFLFTE